MRQTAILTTFTIATNEFRGGGAERTEYHPCMAWDRLTLAEIVWVCAGSFVRSAADPRFTAEATHHAVIPLRRAPDASATNETVVDD